MLTWLALTAQAAHDNPLPREEIPRGALVVPLESLAALAAEASPRLTRLEMSVARIAERQDVLGRDLPYRRALLYDRYALAISAADEHRPLAQTRLGWLLFEDDPQGATFQWLQALTEDADGEHADWAHMGLGEAAMARGDLRGASEQYSAVVAGGGELAGLAAHRRGQVAFCQSLFHEAAGDLVRASLLGDEALRERAVLDLARTVVGDSADGAAAWFDAACSAEVACLDAAWARWRQERALFGIGIAGNEGR